MAKDLKPHIGIYGKRNSGKSSLINALTGQDTAIVSNIAGTTTDPVKKSVEIFGIGPAIIIDTAGIDDIGELGQQRIKKSINSIKQIDLALLVFSDNKFGQFELDLIDNFKQLDTPYLIVHNKSDQNTIDNTVLKTIKDSLSKEIIETSVFNEAQIANLVEEMKKNIPKSAYVKPSLFEGLINKDDTVVLVTPIDSEAPEGRMILPQVMAIRDVLDHDCICIVIKEDKLEQYLKKDKDIALVVTDSQAFDMVSKIVPDTIPLTGFSVLFSRLKANFDAIIQGTTEIDNLKDGDRVLILESCTHQVSCEDIGRFKLPRWLKEYTKKDIEFDIVSGLQDFEEKLDKCSMVIQCGGCVATQKQIKNRLKIAIDRGIPVSNYGMAIAYTTGIFNRITAIFNK